VTSHLSGLFYRNMNLLIQGIKLVYVFDGEPPELKELTHKSREGVKVKALEKYREARESGEIEEMAKYARQVAKLDEIMVEESKQLLHALGVPVIQAPGEGEAQAAFMARIDKRIYAVASQDYDALLFGTPRLVQNLTLAKKRKLASGAFVPVQPELIELERVLNILQISHDQLISLGILVGTDYNPGGIKGIGQKKALGLVKQYRQPAIIFKSIEKQLKERGVDIEFDWQEIFSLFRNPKVTKDYELKFEKPNYEKIFEILCEEHDFSKERVENALQKLAKQQKAATQSELNRWF